MSGEPIRVWVAGCATGEEAYSIAILLLEEAQRRETICDIQIFATDLDAGALTMAREGRYPTVIEADVSEQRLKRFFTREGDNYRIKKDARDLVVFASHSVLKDPPFSRLDLVSCRNLLIYLERGVQNQLLATLHYALKPGGYLFLGSAETVDAWPSLFRIVDRKARISQAVEGRSERLALSPRPPLIPVFAAPRVGRAASPPVVPGAAVRHGRALGRDGAADRAGRRRLPAPEPLRDRRTLSADACRAAVTEPDPDRTAGVEARCRRGAQARFREGRIDPERADPRPVQRTRRTT